MARTWAAAARVHQLTKEGLSRFGEGQPVRLGHGCHSVAPDAAELFLGDLNRPDVKVQHLHAQQLPPQMPGVRGGVDVLVLKRLGETWQAEAILFAHMVDGVVDFFTRDNHAGAIRGAPNQDLVDHLVEPLTRPRGRRFAGIAGRQLTQALRQLAPEDGLVVHEGDDGLVATSESSPSQAMELALRTSRAAAAPQALASRRGRS